MERLVLGYDGSPAAESALDWVSDRAAQRSVLVEVVSVPGALHADSDRADRLLDKAEHRLRMRIPGLPIETSRLDGPTAHTLASAAEGNDLLVIGVAADHPYRSAARGWIPQRVSSSSSSPVCLVPAGWSPSTGAVCVGLDSDGSSDAALEFAVAEATATREALRIVHAWSPQSDTGRVVPSSSRQERPNRRHALIEAAVKVARARNPVLDVTAELPRDNPTAALATAARSSSLIVIGTHKRGILAAGWAGCVAMDLIGMLSIPICVVPVARS